MSFVTDTIFCKFHVLVDGVSSPLVIRLFFFGVVSTLIVTDWCHFALKSLYVVLDEYSTLYNEKRER